MHRRIRALITIFSFLLSFSSDSFAPPTMNIVALEDPQKFQACHDALMNVIATKLQQRKGPMRFGHYSGLARSLETSGLDLETKIQAVAAVDALYELRDSNQELFSDVRRYVLERGDDLFLCVLNAKCRIESFNGLETMAYYMPIGSQIYFKTGSLIEPFIKGDEVGLTRFMDVIVQLHPPKKDFKGIVTWAATHFHELTHFRDAELFSQWLIANQRRINRGEKPDAIYQSYIRIVPRVDGESIIIIHEGFYRSFLESRAYFVGYFSENYLRLPKSKDKPIQTKEACFRQIKESGGEDFLNFWGVTESNVDGIFDVGLKLGEMMKKTITEEGLEF